MTARKSLASKIEATLMAKFGKKIDLWRVGQGAEKVWHAVTVAANQTTGRKIMARVTYSIARFCH
jgi:hypothetical protein